MFKKNNNIINLSGFSLLELMIVIIIVGILTSIAYPSYHEHIARARRADGKAALLDIASRMERYYGEHNTYQTATIGTGASSDIHNTIYSPEGWYTLSINTPTSSSYLIKATPINAQATNDKQCQTLTYNNVGIKGIMDGPNGTPTGTIDTCW